MREVNVQREKEDFTSELGIDAGKNGKAEDVHAFVQRALQLRRERCLTFRETAGYSPEEVEEMQEHFKHFDADDSGAICNSELRSLLENYFPELSASAKLRPYLLQLMAEVDADKNGELDFQDFLRFMRQVHDLQERDLAKKEQLAVRETRFEHEEIEGFRDVFLNAALPADGERKQFLTELSFNDLAKMLADICPLGAENRGLLFNIYEDVVDSRSQGADFPEFLRIMRRLLDDDFANVKEHTREAGEIAKRVAEAHGRHLPGRRISQLVAA